MDTWLDLLAELIYPFYKEPSLAFLVAVVLAIPVLSRRYSWRAKLIFVLAAGAWAGYGGYELSIPVTTNIRADLLMIAPILLVTVVIWFFTLLWARRPPPLENEG